MDFEATRLQRQQALEEKRKRLEEMRKARKEKTEIESQANSTNNIESKVEVDNILNNLLPPPPPPSIEITTNDNNNNNNNIEINNSDPILSKEEINEIKQNKLTTVKNIGSVQIFPYRIETYEKDCQTDDIDIYTGNDNSIDGGYDNKQNNEQLQNSPQKISHIRQRSSSYSKTDNTPFKGKIPSSPTNDSDGGLNLFASQSSNLIPLTNEEKDVIINSSSFKSFLDKSSRYIERTLSMTSIAGSDVIRDYITDGINGSSVYNSKKTLTLLSVVEDESIGKRPVMDINFSPHFPELFLAAYGSEIIPNKQNKASTSSSSSSLNRNETEFPGLICIWSTIHKTRPEFKFTSSSPVLTARFHEQDPHLIIGCCYSGQILLWDMRAKSLPV
jgi:dynein intermediate chain